MRSSTSWLARRALVASAVLVACGGGPPGDPPIDPSCARADTTCPAEPPFASAPCEGALSCDYETALGSGTFECVAGRWAGEVGGCDGCAPPLAESCDAPSAGAPGAVEIGPSGGAFRSLEGGERVPVEWGAQGFAMIAYRVRAGGSAPPECARVTSRIRLDDGSWVQTTRPLPLRCSESLRVLEILPDLPCTFRDYTVDLEVDVEGVGTGAAHLVIEGGGCPRALPG